MNRCSRRTSDFVLRTFLFLGASLPALLVAQAPKAFDVAAIKPNNSGAIGEQVRFYPPSGRVTMTNVTVKRMIQNAYRLQDQQIAGGPGWITSEHFDIVANSEASNLSPDDRWMMVRALLADRFKLKMHTEPREQSVFALVLARSDGKIGSQLRKSETACAAPTAPRTGPIDLSVPNQCGVIMGGPGRMNFRGVTMEMLDSARSYVLGQYPLNFETAADWAAALVELEFYGLGADYIDDYAAKLRDVTLPVARSVIDHAFPNVEDLAIVLIGDAEKIRDVASRYGEVTEMALTQPTFTP